MLVWCNYGLLGGGVTFAWAGVGFLLREWWRNTEHDVAGLGMVLDYGGGCVTIGVLRLVLGCVMFSGYNRGVVALTGIQEKGEMC